MSITKLRIKTTPNSTTQYLLTIDFKDESMWYSFESETKQTVKKLDETQLQACRALLDKIKQIDSKHYQGNVSMIGYYWEFDLVNEQDQMVEIEGINRIDETILSLIQEAEFILCVQLGSDLFSKESV